MPLLDDGHPRRASSARTATARRGRDRAERGRRRRDRLRPRHPRRRRRRAAHRRAEGCDRRTRHPSPRSTRASTSSRRRALRAHLALVGTANAQGEKYLTDVVALLRDSRLTVARVERAGCRGRPGRERPGAAGRGRAPAQRAHRAPLAARGRDDPRPGDDVDRRRPRRSPPTSRCCRTRTSCARRSIAEGATVGPDTSLVDCEVGEGAIGDAHRCDARRHRRRRHRRPVRLPAPGHRTSARGARSARSSRRRTPRSASAARCRTCRTSATRRSARGVNLGAGAITANYDDIAKHRTEIGDEVHSGLAQRLRRAR